MAMLASSPTRRMAVDSGYACQRRRKWSDLNSSRSSSAPRLTFSLLPPARARHCLGAHAFPLMNTPLRLFTLLGALGLALFAASCTKTSDAPAAGKGSTPAAKAGQIKIGFYVKQPEEPWF